MKNIIGLTGTTGAGKSTVSKIFAELGFFVIDCDVVARRVVESNVSVLNQLKAAFGVDIINTDGSLNRRLLASKAFANRSCTDKLNSITLPAIINEVNSIVESCNNEFILLDAPTLFESGADKLCKETVCVIASNEIRIKRITERDNLSYEEAVKRISAQHNNEFFEENCTYIINNSGDMDLLKSNAGNLAKLIINNSLKG